MTTERNPWLALSALIIGFFLTIIDMTIIAVANPAIMVDLDATVPQVIWVTSAYLLCYAVPLLACGRLGDRFGPKYIYLAGLAVFTVASLLCGLADSIGLLIAARALQGLGSALMTPQTMAVITRIFPQAKRGAAMALWGAVAGLATLVGPILGGLLVDWQGWEWIFLINIPIGLVGLVLGALWVPKLPTFDHKFDNLGVALNAIGLFLVVYGLQEGDRQDWGAAIWAMIVAGLLVLAGFVYTQWRNRGEPLLPLGLFRDRNFALSTLAIASIGATVAALMVPLYFYLETVRGKTPTQAALLFAPMAVVTLLCAPLIGKFVDRLHPRIFPMVGFSLYAVSLLVLSMLMTPTAPLLLFVSTGAFAGIANACIWAPLAATATRNLPDHQAGAGSGVYNAVRQVGSVVGSAAVAAVITARMTAHSLGEGKIAEGGAGTSAIPDRVKERLSEALSESMYLPIVILLIGLVAVLLFGSETERTVPEQVSDKSAGKAREVVAVNPGDNEV